MGEDNESSSKSLQRAQKMRDQRILDPTTKARCKETARTLRDIGDELDSKYFRRQENRFRNRRQGVHDALVFPLETLELLFRCVVDFFQNNPWRNL